MSEEKNCIAQKVQRWRKYMGLTPEKASVVCCVTQVKYQKFEEGITVPPQVKLNRMSIFAHIDPSYFEENVSLQEFEAKLREQIEKEDYTYKGWRKVSPCKLAEKLISIRNIHHLTKRQMALIANCTIDTYSRLENGIGTSLAFADTSVVACISSYFDIPLSDLFNKEENLFISEYVERIEYQERKEIKKGD